MSPFQTKTHYILSLSFFAGEGTLNALNSEGDGIVLLMKKEAELAPAAARNEMQSRWALVNGEWASFKRDCKMNPGSLSDTDRPTPLQANLIRGTAIMERTSQSVFRATQVAQESEQIGTEVVNELGVQREALVRTRERITDTNQDLNKANKIIRSMNRRVLTNKCLLIVIILMEVAILIAVVYWKFFTGKK